MGKRLGKLMVPAALVLGCLFGSQAATAGAAAGPLEQRSGGVGYISGGVGEEERGEIRQRAQDFNLELLFAERAGSYLADVDVSLVNARGETVLDVTSAGPFLLVKLPGGVYGITVSRNGQMQQGKLSIPAAGRRQGIYRW